MRTDRKEGSTRKYRTKPVDGKQHVGARAGMPGETARRLRVEWGQSRDSGTEHPASSKALHITSKGLSQRIRLVVQIR